MLFGPGYVQRCMFVFFIGTVLSLLIDGLWLGTTDYGVFKTLTWFKGEGFGMFIIPFVAIGGFLAALPQLLSWDYSWLHSLGPAGALIRLFLSVVISIGFTWGFITMIWPVIAQVFVSFARGITGLFSRF